MTGLDKIVAKIEYENKTATDAILVEAAKKADALIAEAWEASQQKVQKILSDARAEADRINALAHASAESVVRNRYLEVRNEIVRDIMEKAYEAIDAMDAPDYFELLFRLCVKNAEKGEGVLCLNQRDLMRMPLNFEERINSAIFERGAVMVSKTPVDIENGFVLLYGDIEVNCTLRAVFEERADDCKDLLNPMLFA